MSSAQPGTLGAAQALILGEPWDSFLRACFETGWLGGVVALGVGELLVDRWLLRPDLTRSSGAIIAH
ncbi:MAG: hypothetical protein ACR2JX_05900, partial [Mycobacteriales bacterium]